MASGVKDGSGLTVKEIGGAGYFLYLDCGGSYLGTHIY